MYIIRVDQSHALVMLCDCLPGCVNTLVVEGSVVSSGRHAAVNQTHKRKVRNHLALSQGVVQLISHSVAPFAQEISLQQLVSSVHQLQRAKKDGESMKGHRHASEVLEVSIISFKSAISRLAR